MLFLTRWTSFAYQSENILLLHYFAYHSDINLKISYIRKTNKHVNRLVYASMNDAGKGLEVPLVDSAEIEKV